MKLHPGFELTMHVERAITGAMKEVYDRSPVTVQDVTDGGAILHEGADTFTERRE